MSPGVGAARMEEPALPVSSSDPQETDGVIVRFADLCQLKELALGEYVKRDAMDVFRKGKNLFFVSSTSLGTRSPEEMGRYWSAFVLFSVPRLIEGEVKEGQKKERASLCWILSACKLKIVDFFNEFPLLSLKAGHIFCELYGSDWEKRLKVKELQENVLQLIDMSKFYKKGFQELFSMNNMMNKDRDSTDYGSSETVLDFYRFGWMLFLALRPQLLSHCKNVVTCKNELVSVLAILILHIPPKFRKFCVQETSILFKQSHKKVNLLASLSEIYHTSEDELKRTMEKIHSLIVDVLKKKPYSASGFESESLDNIDTDGLTYFEDLLERESLNLSLEILEKVYDESLSIRGELDERIFINTEVNILSSESAGGTTSLYNTECNASPSKTIACHLAPNSPTSLNGSLVHNSKMTLTPVSTAMTTARWLRDIISPLPSEPSAELQCFFSSCNLDIMNIVTHRANIILETIFPSPFGECSISGSFQGANLSEDIAWAHERKMEALKLYYKVLKEISLAESRLLNHNNLTPLLSNERFHRCLLACAAELVLATHKTVILMFPAVLDRTGLTAFDMSKVIETFIRYEETLPRELKRHLNSLEERLLESMAWERAEPMPSLDAIAMHQDISNGCMLPKVSQKIDAFPDNRGEPRSPKRLCTESKSLLPQCGSTPTGKKHILSFSCFKFKSPSLQSKFASPSQSNPAGGEIYAETGIKVFFNKILKLAAIRIKSLCEKIELPQQILEHVFCLLIFFIQVCHIGLTFMSIIDCYQKQPQCKPQVFKSIFVALPSANRNGRMVQEHVDIITFYNQIFVPSVKPLLVEIQTNGVTAEEKNHTDGQTPNSPKLCQFPSLPDMSPKKVSAAHNVYVSPMRQTKMDALLSPSSRSYYACIGESTRAYRSPSSDLLDINNCLNGNRRRINGRLNFDFVSDAVVARFLSSQNDSCVSSNDHETPNLPMKREEPDS
ncbi:hypothetical protein ZIOFF_069318 [Zingiber officinale]|uniref:Retinoblastoma-related protein 1 n=1 Tax=Zingiber officinale TaxID=94328 RepID=A0A8J5BGT3_ZINOF|nr:hypothetical protein ZIOFF_069318 [Zingiber officinale]